MSQEEIAKSYQERCQKVLNLMKELELSIVPKLQANESSINAMASFIDLKNYGEKMDTESNKEAGSLEEGTGSEEGSENTSEQIS
jgi:hypothetical protein